jgi:dimethylargininase
MQVGSHFFIGLSDRTNRAGAEQMISILEKYAMTGETVELKTVLHLKTGVVSIENNNLVVSGEFTDKPNFRNFNKIIVDDDEAYSANCIWFNNKVIVPLGFPKSKQRIEAAGYETVELDMSEFQKLDGGLSCLSLRF